MDPRRNPDPSLERLPTLSSPGPPSRSDPEPAGSRFFPGTRFANRYRIVELLGRGGMGEVYRADDLHLGQTIALKFLPRHLANDSTALARMRNEVRIARQVSHANVCRVYDLVEAEGLYFLTMEYVDGEDLDSVLRRLGRPTAEKALQIARQLCAGLAAAHAIGVLHRDLKPANVMIDGQGKVRITDFGLAAFTRELADNEARAGTPGYMAPECLSGHGMSARSDLYALGLVLYELFTGKRAFSAGSLEELKRQQLDSPPPDPSRIVATLDPLVSRVIVRCLEPDPRQRPVSALEVAAALPGSDPLAEALAAGETPAPDVVAAAGGRGGLARPTAITALVAILGGLAVLWSVSGFVGHHLPAPSVPHIVLADRARSLMVRLGMSEAPRDRAFGFLVNYDYLNHVKETDRRPGRWQRLRAGRPTPYQFWYRESPEPLVPWNPDSDVTLRDPPSHLPGMASLILDASGRLEHLELVPPVVDVSPSTTKPLDFALLFEAAGLDPDGFNEAEPVHVPPRYADERRAWEGHYPGQTEPPVRVEAASYRGRPIAFDVILPYSKSLRESTTHHHSGTERVYQVVAIGLLLLAILGAPYMARRSLRHGSGDRQGAFRLGVVILVATAASGLAGSSANSLLAGHLKLLLPRLAMALLLSVWTACAYLAVEPYARRTWPQVLITWNRVLLGQIRDPRVGRDILVGAAAGIAVIFLQWLEFLVPRWLGSPSRPPYGTHFGGFLDSACHLLEPGVLAWPTFVLLFLAWFRALFRKPWLAAVGTLALFVFLDGHWKGLGATGSITVVSALVEVICVAALLLFVLIRFGLFASMVAYFFVFRLQIWSYTLDISAWYAGSSMILLVLLTAITLYAFRIAVASPLRAQGTS